MNTVCRASRSSANNGQGSVHVAQVRKGTARASVSGQGVAARPSTFEVVAPAPMPPSAIAFKCGKEAGSQGKSLSETLRIHEYHKDRADYVEFGWKAGAYEFVVEQAEAKNRRRKKKLPVPSYAEFLAGLPPSPVPKPQVWRSTLGVPDVGTYRVPNGAGSVPLVFDSLGNGFYRIRTCSGGGCGPALGDKGFVVTEAEMYKRLVAAGSIRP